MSENGLTTLARAGPSGGSYSDRYITRIRAQKSVVPVGRKWAPPSIQRKGFLFEGGGSKMPKVKINDITMNYERQGTGEPLVLIPYLAADNACYAFQVAEYAKHSACISVDPRGAGETDKPAGTYSTQLFADDIAAFM